MQKTDARQVSPNLNDAKLHFLDYWRVIRVRFGIVLLSFLLVVATAAVVTYFMPKKYQSTALVELRPEASDIQPFSHQTGDNPGLDPRFAPTQIEIIQRQKVLYPVIEKLDLIHRWAKEGNALNYEGTYWKLRSMLTLKPVRNTELLDVTATSTDAKEAAELANAVVQAYQDLRLNERKQLGSESIGALDTNLDEKREKVNDIEKKLIEIRRQNPQLRDYTLPNSMATEDPRKVQLDAKQAEVDKYQTQVAALTTQLDKVEHLKGEELMRALNTLDIPDTNVQKLLPQYQDAVTSLAAMLRSGLGQGHPKVASLRATIATVSQQLTDQVDSIKHSLAIKLDVAKKTLESVKAQLADLREEQRKASESGVDYYTLQQDYQNAKRVLLEAEQRKQQIQVDKAMPTRPVLIRAQAEQATVPSSPKVWLNLTLGALVGLIVGIGLAFFIEYLDTSVKTMNDVETLLGVPVLSIVPKDIRLLHKQPTDVPDAEAYRILRTNIEFNRKSADANTLSMVSGGPGEGKSTTLCNLAYICSQGGYSVLIVDADLRRPTQHKFFDINNSVGLTNYLTTNVTLEEVILPTGIENLSILPSGILPADAVGILNSQRMSDMIAELKTRYDIVFFDSPPILGVSDGAVLASEVDQSIIVVQHRRYPRAMLQRVKQAVINVGGTVLGVVLNNVDLRHDPNYSYYTSYYEYYAPGRDKPAARTGTALATAGASNGAAGHKQKAGSRRGDY